MISKQMKLRLSFFLMFLNHSITDAVLFHWLILVALIILVLILSKICLLIFPISDLVGYVCMYVLIMYVCMHVTIQLFQKRLSYSQLSILHGTERNFGYCHNE